MYKRLVLISMVLGILAIAFGGTTPGRAQGGEPPQEDIITLTRVADIYFGSLSSSLADLAAYNGALYFRADGNDGAGIELWKYDPINGATRAADIYTGSTSSDPAFLVVYNSALYFQANGNDGAGYELWKYDPTNGAQRAADIYTGSVGSFPSSLAVYNGALYFQANGNDGAGYELWKYDPTNGAQRVEDIFGGSGSSFPADLAVYNGALYFQANGNDGAGYELWKYDPANGAQRVADIRNGSVGSAPAYLALYNGALYFNANGNDGAGYELWKYDPANGAQRVADIYTGSGSSYPASLAVYNGALYFSANGNDGAGEELWMYDNSATDAFRSVKGYDGWVAESGENTNVGGALNTGATTFNLGDNAANRQFRSLLSFDTSTLPDSAVIIKVTLKIRKQGLVGTDPFTTHGVLYVDIRNGAFGGNPALQLTDFQAAASKAFAGAIPNTPVGGWYAKTWTSGIFAYINKTGITQFRLRFQTDDNNDLGADYLKFFSGDTTTLAYRPLLEVKYYMP